MVKKKKSTTNPEQKNQRSAYADLFASNPLDMEAVIGVDGVDSEIDLLRFLIRKIIEGETNPRVKLIIQATNSIERLARTRYHITAEHRRSLRESVQVVLQDIAVPLGLTLGKRLSGD